MANIRYPDHPMIGIGVVVWKGDEVLLVQRKNPPAQGQWALPGGKQQVGETIFETAVREVREETSLEISVSGVITAIDAITKDAKGKIEYHYTLIEMSAEWVSGEAKAGDDALDVLWTEPQAVETLCGWPEVSRIVRLSMLQRIL